MSKPIFPRFEEEDFKLENEVWNIYELEDGRHRVTLKMRTVLTKVLKPRFMKDDPLPPGVPPDAKQMQFGMSFQNIVVVSNCPPELMGKPSPPVSPAESQKLPREEIKFIPFYEDWNVYGLSDGMKIRVKLVVSSIEKVLGRYDQFGYPIYNVQSTNAVIPALPKKRRQKK